LQQICSKNSLPILPIARDKQSVTKPKDISALDFKQLKESFCKKSQLPKIKIALDSHAIGEVSKMKL
jgi:hypothetical protein